MRFSNTRLALVALVAIAVPGVLAGPAGAAPGNDNWANAATLTIGTPASGTNVSATYETSANTFDEPITPATSGNGGCTSAGVTAANQGFLMANTVWWRVVGNGKTLTITTRGSAIDSILAAYREDNGVFQGCHDDLHANWNPAVRQSELRIPNASAAYRIQVGSACAQVAPTCSSFATPGPGAISVAAYTPPANDLRANATTIEPGQPASGTNRGALEEAGETSQCTIGNGGTTYLGKTIWFKFVTASKGKATFISSANFDNVLGLYQGDSNTPLACDDDLSTSQTPSARLTRDLEPGTYYLQVGGYGTGVGSDAGTADMSVTFEANTNHDGDPVPGSPGTDCNDEDPSIYPGNTEIPNNGKDDDCVGGDSHDTDGDGTDDAQDCMPGDKLIHPHASEIPGNDVDENCDGFKQPKQLEKPSIDLDTAAYRRGLTFEWLKIGGLQPGDRILVRCKGSRACPRTYKRTAAKRRYKLRLFWHRYITRGRVEVLITRPGKNVYGFYWQQTIRGHKEELMRHCLLVPVTNAKTQCGKGA